MWTIRLKREGSQVLVTDYQKHIIQKLLSEKEKIGSGAMWKHLIEIMGENHPSRASVIFFLNDLEDFGYASFNEATGKGGYHKLYYTELTQSDFAMKIHNDIGEKLKDAICLILQLP